MRARHLDMTLRASALRRAARPQRQRQSVPNYDNFAAAIGEFGGTSASFREPSTLQHRPINRDRGC